MFGVAPIRTRSEQMELAHAGMHPRAYNETGAESALVRTKSLLESTVKQQKYVVSNLRLAADARSDELAALGLLQSCLTQLHNCIIEHDNPPPTISKRKVLIKVEKARREVLAAVRECNGRVADSQKLFEEVERFIELRPDEPVSPRHFNIKWNRLAPARLVPRSRRDQAYGRALRPGDSLVASIVGLSAIAEGRDRDTPTSDVGGPTSVFVPTNAPPGKPPQPPARSPSRGPDQQLSHHTTARAGGVPAEPPAGQPETPVVEGGHVSISGPAHSRKPAAASSNTTGAASASAAAAVIQQQPSASQLSDAAAVAAAAVMVQRLQLQPRVTVSSDGDDLRPSLSHDVAQSSVTTMCNLDSCVSGPNPTRGPTSRQATAGGEGAESRRRSYNTFGDEDCDGEGSEDEVNSAEARGFETGSPNHRVALLGGQRAAAAMRSTAGTVPPQLPPLPQPLPQPQASAGQPTMSAGLSGAASGMSVTGGYGGGFAGVGAAMTAADAPLSAKATEAAAMRGLESEIHSYRSYTSVDQRRRQSAININTSGGGGGPMPIPPLGISAAATATSATSAAPPAHHQGLLAEGSKAAAAAADLDAIDAIAAAAQQQQQQLPASHPSAVSSRYISPGAGRPPLAPPAPHTVAAVPGAYGTVPVPESYLPPAQAPLLPPQQQPQHPQHQQTYYQQQQPLAQLPQHYPVSDAAAADGARGHYPAGMPAAPPVPQYGAAAAGAVHCHHGGYPAQPQPLPHAMPHVASHPAHAAAAAAAAAHPYGPNGFSHPYMGVNNNNNNTSSGGGAYSLPPSGPSSLRDFPIGPHPGTRPGTSGGMSGAGMAPHAGAAGGGVPQRRLGSQPPSGHHSLDSGQFPASATAWDNVSLADTEPLPGANGQARRGRRGGKRRGGGLFGIVRNVVGFVGVSMLSGAAMVLGAAAVNTGLDEQEAQQARQRHGNGRRIPRGGDDLIPQRALQQLRSPDLLALGRG